MEDAVTLSPKFQVVIPRSVRQTMGLRAGQKLRVLPYGNHIVLVPVRPMEEAEGMLEGIDTTVEREEDRL
jgi:AbrB family looped-hinge helix DNA binding protein